MAKNKNRVIAVILTAVMFFICIGEFLGTTESLQAAAFYGDAPKAFLENTQQKNGKMPETFTKVDFKTYGVDAYMDKKEAANVTGLKGSVVYNSNWDCYSTNYYYNLMNEKQQAFWDALDAMCMSYLTTNANLETYTAGWSLTKYVSCDLSLAELQLIGTLFRYSNPQYYFIQGICYEQSGKALKAAFTCYDVFLNGQSRASATASFKQRVEAMVRVVNGYTTDIDKAKAAHDLVCGNVVYNYECLDANGIPSISLEPTYLTQSAYSAFCMGKTVCAGYAHAYEMLCNAVGVDTICVTSTAHEWNKSYVNGAWYNVDCTWDDYEGGFYYICFLRSDYVYDVLDNSGMHTEENYYASIQPVCVQDTGSDYYTAGSLPVSYGKMAPVTITTEPYYTKDEQGKTYVAAYTVSMSSTTAGAAIYFTLDGTTPSIASSKSYRYTNPFTITYADDIQAVAYADNYQASEVSKNESCTVIDYTITYELNGGKNNRSNPKTFTTTSNEIQLKDAAKTGYTFAGWYTDKEFKNKIKTIPTGSYGNLQLYAKFTPIKYKVKFAANGGKGSMAAMTLKYGSAKKIKACTMKKSGYKFMGWSTTKNGKVKYKNKASIKNLSSKNGKTVTLYAVWKKVK